MDDILNEEQDYINHLKESCSLYSRVVYEKENNLKLKQEILSMFPDDKDIKQPNIIVWENILNRKVYVFVEESEMFYVIKRSENRNKEKYWKIVIDYSKFVLNKNINFKGE